ncbi:hypothetical protein GCM10011348_04610 [Marinobacterium nitratireducens]|uniref:Uncharacterized protein n=1 Tax=Marinobacterium nitratireducens TaxID=518897 RepID=A0A917Z6V2_9GAMM|nr:hypothetical protein [Marinobacterium nitratireducens]GGO76724.1 hypothetical protein GCM10011348_04610 [Marinobacterium nitratireducens]
MNTDILKAIAAIKQSVLSDWEKLQSSAQKHEYDYVQGAQQRVERVLNETLTKLYDVYGVKYVVLETFMQLDGLLTMELSDILPVRGEYEHLCFHELLHILLVTYIMDELVAIGEDRGYFSADDNGFAQAGIKAGQRHH